MRDLTEYESELVLDALASYLRTMDAESYPRTSPTPADVRTLRAELVEDHRARFTNGEPPVAHFCRRCGTTVQTMGPLGWASTSTGGLECGYPRAHHDVVERCRSLSAEGTRCELPSPDGPVTWSHGGSPEDPNAARHRGTNTEGQRVRWACGNGQPEEPVPATCESCGADRATMWDQHCQGSTSGRHTWRYEGDAPSELRPDEEAALAKVYERLDAMLTARRDRPAPDAEIVEEPCTDPAAHSPLMPARPRASCPACTSDRP